MTDLADTLVPAKPAPSAPVWARRLLKGLDALWRHGQLHLILPNGARWTVGRADDNVAAPPLWRLHRWAAIRRMILRGDVGFAEGYIAGDWDTPDLTRLLVAFADNYDALDRLITGSRFGRAFNAVRHALSRNSKRGSRRNIMAHYDLGNAFYAQWLDPSLTYSSALFTASGQSLEAAQQAKYAALAKAADIQPGQRVLEIGCGWGGFALFLAREHGVHVTGLTLSPAQKEVAERRVAEAGLQDQIAIRLVDYRDVEGTFDRIVSVEMFEAVGEAYWPTFFRTVRDRLTPDGRAALQIITIRDDLFDGYSRRPDFIQLHVFPGGMLPSEQALTDPIAKAGLSARVERRFGRDYAETLKRWLTAFDAAWPRLTGDYDERFRRLWRYYLAYCEAGFATGRTDVVHLVVTPD